MRDSVFWPSSDEDEEEEVARCMMASRKRQRSDDPRPPPSPPAPPPPHPPVPATSTSRFSAVDKAGLASVDAEHVRGVIAAATQGSAFAAHEEERRARVTAKVAKVQARLQQLRLEERTQTHFLARARSSSVVQSVARHVASLEALRDLTQTFLCVDMDSFYCMVELRDNPALAGKPFAVGSDAMLSTSSYEARAYGVRSAMPGFLARKLCPHLVLVPCDFAKYQRVAGIIRAVFASYDPHYESQSLDEASLNISAHLRSHQCSALSVALELQQRVERDTGGCTCSVGIAPNRALAKIASNQNKPHGVFELAPSRDALVAFMHTLPLRRVCGIGPVAEGVLTEGFGLRTCGGLLEARHDLARVVSQRSLLWYLNVALGFPDSEAEAQRPDKKRDRLSMSCEHTSGAVDEVAPALAIAFQLAERLAGDMQQRGVRGSCLTLKLKGVDFRVHSRSVSLPAPVNDAQVLKTRLRALVEEELRVTGPVRLIGVRMSTLV